MEYRVPLEKDGIRVEMIVTVDSTVKIGYLITNNRGSCILTLTYYDSLNHVKTITVNTVKGDLNRSTGVIYEFAKPSINFEACFSIDSIQDIADYPQPKITGVYVNGNTVWENDQKLILIYPYKEGVNKMLFGTRSQCYIFRWPSLKITVPPFAGYQWAVVDVGSVVNYCPDQFTYLTVYPSGGDYWVTDRRQRPYIDDFCLSYDKTVKIVKEWESPEWFFRVEGYGEHIYDEYGNYRGSILRGSFTIDKLFTYLTVSADGLPNYWWVKFYHNDRLIAEFYGYRQTVNFTAYGPFYPGDKITVEVLKSTSAYGIYRIYKAIGWYTTADLYFDTMKFSAIYRTWKHEVSINACGVIEEFANTYKRLLELLGYRAIIVPPYSTASP